MNSQSVSHSLSACLIKLVHSRVCALAMRKCTNNDTTRVACGLFSYSGKVSLFLENSIYSQIFPVLNYAQ